MLLMAILGFGLSSVEALFAINAMKRGEGAVALALMGLAGMLFGTGMWALRIWQLGRG